MQDQRGSKRHRARAAGGEIWLALRRAILFTAGALAILAALSIGGRTLPGERPVLDGTVARLLGTTLSGADERVILRSFAPTP